MSGTTPIIVMKGFRARQGDTQTLDSTTWTYAQNTNFSQNVDEVFRLRTLLSDTVTSTKTANKTFGVEFNLASGGWTTVTGTTALQWSTSAQYADDDNISTAQITGGNRSFVTGKGSEGDNAAPTAGNFTLGNGNDHTVVEWALLIDSAQVTNGQTLQVRCTGVDSNTAEVIPTITVVEVTPTKTRLALLRGTGGPR